MGATVSLPVSRDNSTFPSSSLHKGKNQEITNTKGCIFIELNSIFLNCINTTGEKLGGGCD